MRRLLAELTGQIDQADELNEPEQTDAAPRFAVGDICLQGGQKFRVLAVNDDGAPTAAEEVE